jgi:ureidoglycolate amidohydrolase
MSQNDLLSIDSARLDAELERLATFSDCPPPAVTRVLFSDADIAARAYVRALCEEAGLTVRVDPVGNMFARWQGSDPALAALATGSHIDAIPNAGRYDGTLGVLGPIAAVRALRAAGFQPIRSLEIITFTAEEPTRFGLGCLGSRLMAGTTTPEAATALRDPEGRGLGELRAAAGCTGELSGVRLSQDVYAGFIELHIEQGPILEREGFDIGTVEKIAAPSSARLTLHGEGGHAGAMLMPQRHDACLAGAEIALAVERATLGCGSPDAVGTVGVFRVAPGAINSVPNHAYLEIDQRDTDLSARERARAEVREAIEEICARRGIKSTFEIISADPPAISSPELVNAIRASAHALGLRERPMVSRAYHDTSLMSLLCPVAMIFIPCRNGWSHRPDEFAAPAHIAAGVATLAGTLRALLAK